jgi:hypothetical protein
MESKTQKILLIIIFISIITILTTLIALFILYNIISQNLKIKTLKDPFSKLYNTYHLHETLNFLQKQISKIWKNIWNYQNSSKKTQ